jgi:hypothetical protein
VVAVVDAADGGVAPIDDAHPSGSIHIRPRPDENVAASAPFLQAKMAEIGACEVNDARHPLSPLGAYRSDGVHLIEESRQVLRLGNSHLLPKLEQAGIVDLRGARAAYRPLLGSDERALDDRKQPQLLPNHEGARPVVVETVNLIMALERASDWGEGDQDG